MKISKEAKVGLLALISGVILYVGFNFLKGIDFFSTTNVYYAVYEDISGLQVSNPVMLSGKSIGRVSETQLIGRRGDKILVAIDIEEEVQLTDSTMAFIESDIVQGTSVSLRIQPGTPAAPGDTIIGASEEGLMGQIASKGGSVLSNLDSLVVSLNSIFGDELGTSVGNTLHNLERSSANLQAMLDENRGKLSTTFNNLELLTAELRETQSRLQPVIVKVDAFADTLSTLEIKRTVAQANLAMENLQEVTRSIQQGEGSLGKVINDDELYVKLLNAVESINQLICNLNYNPRHYLSPLGRKPRNADENNPCD